MRVVIFNQKGGVGKTTTAATLSAALASLGDSVTVVDLDPQQHLTAIFAAARTSARGTAADWLAGRPVVPAPWPALPGLSVLPGAIEVLDETPAAPPAPFDSDWTVIDAPPAWGPALASLIATCDLVICPLEPDFLGLNGLNQLMRRMQDAGLPRDRLRVLITRYSNRLSVHREVRGTLIDRFGSATLLPAVIRSSVRLAEAPGAGQTVLTYAPRSTGTSDYIQLARALMAQRALANRS